MAYLVPFNEELNVPYRAKKELMEKVRYIFSHPSVPSRQRKLFIDVSQSGSRGLINDMSVRAIAMVRYFVAHPQQFGGSMENIYLQVLRRMWVQTFKHMFKQQRTEHTDAEWVYLGITYKHLAIDNGLWDELLRCVREEDYYQSADSMVKQRDGLELRETRKPKQEGGRASLREGNKQFEYLCSLD